MLIAVIFFAAVSAVMLFLLLREDKKNDKLIEENGWLNAKIGSLNEQLEANAQPVKNEPVTAEGIMDAVRFAGYVPEKDNIVFSRLMDAGKLLIARIKNIEEKGTFTRIRIGICLVDF